MEPEIAFGQVLRELRKQKHLSQEKLALESGVERNYISLLELGKNSATVKIIFRISPVLGIQPSQFLLLVEERLTRR